MTHDYLCKLVLIEANKIPGVKLWRNPIGFGIIGTKKNEFIKNGKSYVTLQNPRHIKFGLAKGSSDLIGFCMCKKHPIFLAVEIKIPPDTLSWEQKNFIDMVNAHGGIAGEVKKVEDFFNLINSHR